MADPDTAAAPGLHVCVLIHGLWGNPNHLQTLANSLRAAHPDEDALHILLAKSNSGNFTYDGVEKGAERTMREIEDELEALEAKGKRVTRFSMTGYSLGGLVARYVVGLMFSKGYFDAMEPVNFTTFATPHLGTRAPAAGWSSDFYNAMGPKTLSVSGKQLWAVDDFRGTGRPLLGVLAEPGSIFLRGLGAFRNRFLYANIVNDRAVPFYTAYISAVDPFVDLTAIDIAYEPGWEDVILTPALAAPKGKPLEFYESVAAQGRAVLYKMPLYLAFGILGPVAALAYLGNAGVQSIQSAARIKQHEEGTAGFDASAYHLPALMERAQHRTGEALQQLGKAAAEVDEGVAKDRHPPASTTTTTTTTTAEKQGQEDKSLPLPDSAVPSEEDDDTPSASSSSLDKHLAYPERPAALDDESNKTGFPTLALTKEQFAMKEALDAVGFEKFPVHIKNANHSHAAIIIRMQRPGFGEGKVVSRHWLARFEI